MKNTLKKTVLGLAILALLLCLTGCPLFEEDKPWSPRPATFEANPAGVYTYWSDLEVEGDNIQLFFDDNYHQIKITCYVAAYGFDFVFDSVAIKDATVGFYLYDSGNSGNLFHSDISQMTPEPQSFAEYMDLLPTGPWTIEFRSTSDPDKNFDHVIKADMVNKIRAWMATN